MTQKVVYQTDITGYFNRLLTAFGNYCPHSENNIPEEFLVKF